MGNLPSLASLAVGGILVACQVFAGIVGLSAAPLLRPGARGAVNQIKLMAAGFSLAVPFLALGGWLSAGSPWSAMGIALLAGAALGCTGYIILLLPDPDGSGPKREELDLVPGAVNLALILGAGLMLLRYGLTHPA